MRPPQIARHAVLTLAVFGTVAVAFALPPVPQDPAYHVMADQRAWLGIPNCLNVLSNLPFAVVGLLGLATLGRASGPPAFSHLWERWPYAALFVGTALTALGSTYYHLAPNNGRLVWDRLPMTVAFMGLLTAILAERVSLRVGQWVFIPLLALGAGSVAYWYWSELQGAGDLRMYAVVQFGSLLLVVLLLVLYPSRYSGAGYLFTGLAAYAAAKGFELADEPIFAVGQIVSGHTLKHIAAAGGLACVVAMIRARVPCAYAETPPNKRLQPAAAGPTMSRG
jgi:hypothetical protein